MISVGRIIRSQGKEGELRLKFYQATSIRFAELKKIQIKKEGILREYNVQALTPKGTAYHLKLEGVENLAQADALARAEVFVAEDILSSLEGGQFYIYQLKGCLVVDTSGRKVGTVVDVDPVPGNTLLVVEKEGQEILIPFHQSICREVDITSKEIRIDPPEGLLDLDEI
ncbi:MAG: ribosome maturation factor RimM [Clostridiales bacterium]|nr:ribosome maturation factor RimM [Clostridiales bacterium]